MATMMVIWYKMAVVGACAGEYLTGHHAGQHHYAHAQHGVERGHKGCFQRLTHKGKEHLFRGCADVEQCLHARPLPFKAVPERLEPQRNAGQRVAHEHAADWYHVLRVKQALPHDAGHKKHNNAQPAAGDGYGYYQPETRVKPFVARQHQINGKKHQYGQIPHGEQRVRMLKKKGQGITRSNELQGHARAGQHQQFCLVDAALFHDGQHQQQQHIYEQK